MCRTLIDSSGIEYDDDEINFAIGPYVSVRPFPIQPDGIKYSIERGSILFYTNDGLE